MRIFKKLTSIIMLSVLTFSMTTQCMEEDENSRQLESTNEIMQLDFQEIISDIINTNNQENHINILSDTYYRSERLILTILPEMSLGEYLFSLSRNSESTLGHNFPNNTTPIQQSPPPVQNDTINLRHNRSYITALIAQLAINQSSENTDNQNKIDINQRDAQTGKTVLIEAAQQKNVSIVQQLLDCEADAGIVDNDGKSALEYAYINNDQETINILIIPTGKAFKALIDLNLD